MKFIAAAQIDRLVDQIDRVLIIAYRESTTQLETSLRREGFVCEVVRQGDEPEYRDCAAIYRCMLNHRSAWKRAAQAEKPTLIVEADFVPVLGLAQLPLPFNVEQPQVGIAWVYTCAPQIYNVSPEGYAEGFSTALVAYILTPQGAKSLCGLGQDGLEEGLVEKGLVEEVTAAHGRGYYNFDSDIDKFLRKRGFKNYVPFRNYGEHGGRSNPEHRHNGMSGIHRADVLYGRLAFLPPYAGDRADRYFKFIQARLQARLKGIGRLLLGKFVRLKILKGSQVRDRLLKFALYRHVALR